MDLYAPFKKAVQTKLKNAVIVADRFHYTRIVANAMDSLRLEIWRNTKGIEKKYLKHLKKKLLKDIESIPKDKLLDFEVNLNYAFEVSSELRYGYQLYQSFLRIKDADTYQERCQRFRDWLDDAESCTIPAFKSAAETLIKWNKEILNSFKYSYSNGPTEGKNNKIKVIKRIAFGFRNCINFENRIKVRDLYI
jgi:transposase